MPYRKGNGQRSGHHRSSINTFPSWRDCSAEAFRKRRQSHSFRRHADQVDRKPQAVFPTTISGDNCIPAAKTSTHQRENSATGVPILTPERARSMAKSRANSLRPSAKFNMRCEQEPPNQADDSNNAFLIDDHYQKKLCFTIWRFNYYVCIQWSTIQVYESCLHQGLVKDAKRISVVLPCAYSFKNFWSR